MALLELHNVKLTFPVYGVAARTIRTDVMRTLGLFGGSGEHDKVLVEALRGINLRAETGDRIALLGGNGTGKSTLLRLMAGIYEPTSGLIQRRGTIRTLFDLNSGMEEDATGRANILIRARYLGASLKRAKGLVDEVVDFAELGSFIDLPIRTYSSGMRLRLAFAISTAFDAEILLVDEILGVGDAHFTEKATERMNRVIANSGLVVMATHALSLSEAVAKRGIVLRQGRVVFDGAYPEAVEAYMHPTPAAAAAAAAVAAA